MKRLIILLLIVSSCKSADHSIVGSFVRHWDAENNSELFLYKDKTFLLQIQEGLMFYETQGTWFYEKRKVTLNSYTDSLKESFIEHKAITDKKGLSIKIKDEEGSELVGTSIDFYHEGVESKFIADFHGAFFTEKESWDSVKIDFIGLNPLTIQYGKENQYDIILTKSKPIGVHLKNAKWRVKNNKILDPRFDKEIRRNAYKKTKKPVKQGVRWRA